MKPQPHRSHVSTIARMKRLLQLWDKNDDFEEWQRHNLELKRERNAKILLHKMPTGSV